MLFAAGEQGVWYDPSDLPTMFQNSNGTTAVAVGDPVGYIADKSGNGNHATQATAAARPILRTSGGLYYLEFDGVDDGFTTPSITFSGNTTYHGAIYHNAGSNWVDVWRSASIDAFWGVGQAGNTALPHQVPFVGSPTYRTNGTALSPVTRGEIYTRSANASVVLTAENLTLATSSITIGKYAASFMLNGRWYGVILRNAVSTAGEVAAAEAYLAAKIGVTL